jgi:hypothetical protein
MITKPETSFPQKNKEQQCHNGQVKFHEPKIVTPLVYELVTNCDHVLAGDKFLCF